jgi:SOS-response transcriptional repressor LexA
MPCGKPASISDLTDEEITLAEMFGVSAENLRCCPAIGDSMVDEGFQEGDLLFADSSLIPKIGDVVLAEIDGEMAVKKIQSQKPKLRLVSCNAAINYQAIEPQFGFHVVGVIVGSFRFRK